MPTPDYSSHETCCTDSGQERAARDRYTYVAIALVLLLAAGLRFYGLHDKSLWFDEIIQVRLAQGLSAVRIIASHLHDPAAPLDPLITHLVVQAGRQEYWLRFPAACFAVLTVAVCFSLGQAMFGPERGLLSAFALTVSAFHIRFSQIVRTYSLLAFLSSLSMLFLWRALSTDRRRDWMAWLVTGWLSLTAHAFSAFLALAQAAYGLLAVVLGSRGWLDGGHLRPRIRKLLTGWSLLLLAAAVQFVLAAGGFSDRAGGRGSATTLNMAYLSTNWIRPARRFLLQVGNGRVAGVLFLAALVGLCATRSARRRPAVWLLVCSCALPPALGIAVSQASFSAKYAISALVPAMVLLAHGTLGLVAEASRRLKLRRPTDLLTSAASLALVAAFLAAAGLPALRSHWSPTPYDRSYHADWRSTASYLAEHVSAGDSIIYDAYSPTDRVSEDWAYRCLSYYLPAEALGVKLLPVRGIGWPAFTISQGTVWGVAFHPDREVNAQSVQSETISFRMITVLRPEAEQHGLQQSLSLLRDLLSMQQSTRGSLDILLASARSYAQMAQPALAHQELDAARALGMGSESADLLLEMTEGYVAILEEAIRGQ